MSPADCPPAFQDPSFDLHKSFCADEINPVLASMYGTALEEVDFHLISKYISIKLQDVFVTMSQCTAPRWSRWIFYFSSPSQNPHHNINVRHRAGGGGFFSFHIHHNFFYFPLLLIQCSSWSWTPLSTDAMSSTSEWLTTDYV